MTLAAVFSAHSGLHKGACVCLLLLLASAGLCAALQAAAGDVGSAIGSSVGWRKPGFCGNMDCPEYTVWQKSPDYEVREYKEAAWVAVNVSEEKYELAIKTATPLLSQYFWGDNSEGLRLKETVPLLTHYRLLHPHTGQRHNFTIAWFLPYNYQDDPPEPSNRSVWIYRHPRATMFVRMFQHRAHEWRVIQETHDLIQALQHTGQDFEPNRMLVAAYSHASRHMPDHHRYHHSEVWMRGTFNQSAVLHS